jgi:hypothetical protein
VGVKASEGTGEAGYIQVGVTSLRNPATGEFMPSVPLFIKASASKEDEAHVRALARSLMALREGGSGK